MKPINIQFQAFGPYKSMQSINFENLQTSSMFIISGPTGSGKTTIFDAICYALFGSASGEERKADMFISEFATINEETFVKFEFEVNNRRYTISRFPRQNRPKKRGEGFTVVESKVTLEFEDTVIIKQKDVSDKIFELLNMTERQFRQIVLLPQGEFSRLLLSDSKTKEEIFRKIFDTQIFNQITNEMQADKSKLEKQYESNLIKRNTILERFGENLRLDNLNLNQENLKMNIETVNQYLSSQRTKLKQLLNTKERLKQFEALTNEKSKLEFNKNQLNERMLPFVDYKIYFDNFELIKNYNSLLLEAEKIGNKIGALDKTILELQTSIEIDSNMANSLLEQKNELFCSEKEVVVAQEEVNLRKQEVYQYNEYLKIESNIIEEQAKLLKIDSDLKALEKQYELKNDFESQKNNIELEINKIEEKVARLDELKLELNALNTLAVTHQELSEKLLVENKALEKLNYLVSSIRDNITAAAISSLTLELEDGKPCPVCGSPNHPLIANPDSSTYTLEELKIAEADHSKKQTEVTTLLHNLQSYSAEIDMRNKAIDNFDLNSEDKNLDHVEKKISDLITSLHNQKKELHLISEKLDHLETKVYPQILKTQSDLATVKGSLQSLNKSKSKQFIDYDIDAANGFITNFNNKIKIYTELSDKLQETNQNIKLKEAQKADASAFRAQEDLDLSRVVENLNNAKTAFSELNIDISKVDVEFITGKYETYVHLVKDIERHDIQLEQITKQINDIDVREVDAIDEKISILSSLVEKAEIIDRLQHSLYEDVSKSISQLNQIDKDAYAVDKKYEVIGKLSDLALGKTSSKISLERYVLSIYFKQIIIQANNYLHKMTNNRFDLVYRSVGTGNAGRGLDLDVFDMYTGTNRDIKTLSGGETFKAALSLSLGLSDVLQINNGGISINAMFIDEGFGTLDNESLNSAIETLIDIESSGRMIGIISHVDELKNQIPNQILIQKSPNGSSLSEKFN